jgi:hypothetical protein
MYSPRRAPPACTHSHRSGAAETVRFLSPVSTERLHAQLAIHQQGHRVDVSAKAYVGFAPQISVVYKYLAELCHLLSDLYI